MFCTREFIPASSIGVPEEGGAVVDDEHSGEESARAKRANREESVECRRSKEVHKAQANRPRSLNTRSARGQETMRRYCTPQPGEYHRSIVGEKSLAWMSKSTSSWSARPGFKKYVLV
jgi:hypothetical protein